MIVYGSICGQYLFTPIVQGARERQIIGYVLLGLVYLCILVNGSFVLSLIMRKIRLFCLGRRRDKLVVKIKLQMRKNAIRDSMHLLDPPEKIKRKKNKVIPSSKVAPQATINKKTISITSHGSVKEKVSAETEQMSSFVSQRLSSRDSIDYQEAEQQSSSKIQVTKIPYSNPTQEPVAEKNENGTRTNSPEVVLEAHEEEDSSFEQYDLKSDFKFV